MIRISFLRVGIILSGIRYPRYAFLTAAALGIIHVACDYPISRETARYGSLIRTGMFLFVAYVTYPLSRRQDRLIRLLRRSEIALKQSYDDLERRIADRTADLISPCSFRLLLGESRGWNPIDTCMPSLAGQSGTKRIENA